MELYLCYNVNMFEGLRKSTEKYPNEQTPHFEELNALGVRWGAILTKHGYKYTFYNAKKVGDNYLFQTQSGSQVLFSTSHYNEDDGEYGFKRKKTDKKTDLDTIISDIREEFPDIDKIILSVCYPAYARKFAEDAGQYPRENIILLGNNDREHSVMFYPKKGIIEVIPRKTSIKNPHKD